MVHVVCLSNQKWLSAITNIVWRTRTLFQIVYLINCKRYILNIYFSFFIIWISYVYITWQISGGKTSIILNFILLNIMSLLNCVSTVSPYCVFLIMTCLYSFNLKWRKNAVCPKLLFQSPFVYYSSIYACLY